MSQVIDIFEGCVKAIINRELIERVSASDKEYHFQNWVSARIAALGINHESPGRNSYPDIPLVKIPEGYEVKGLKYPGRESTYDANSQVPTGMHNGREIFYVFGRYPKSPEYEKEYPVIDLTICHGDFLNADHDYVHGNKPVKGFGTYGDIMIRDRKMYVCPTPFAVAEGLTGTRTLILPADYKVDKRVFEVGRINRIEAEKIVIGYVFDLRTNKIKAKTLANPNAGQEHLFVAYRLKGETDKAVKVPDNE